MDGITITITGLKELQEKLERLPPKAARRAIVEGLMASGIWAAEMRAKVKRYSGPDPSIPVGYLAEHIGIRKRVAGNGFSGTADVGPEKIDYPDRAGGFRTKKDKRGRNKSVGRIRVSSVAAFLEFGTRRSQAFPFIRASFEIGKQSVLDKFIDDVKSALEREGLKLT